MWLKQEDSGIDEIFDDKAVYIESWGPKYAGVETIKHWFKEWNTRGKVAVWHIKQFFHNDKQTIVEWYFKSEMNNGVIDEFDGVSLIVWTENNTIKSVKEFGCNTNNYNPYRNGKIPQFQNNEIKWF